MSADQGWHPLTSAWTKTGEINPSPPSPSAPPSPSVPPTTQPDISIGPNGRINGVDGMLDQIAQALTRHAGPMLVRDVLPAVQRNRAMQDRVGHAAGAAMASSLKPWVVGGVVVLGALTVIEFLRYRDSLTGAKGRKA